jgi:hypothetical protein
MAIAALSPKCGIICREIFIQEFNGDRTIRKGYFNETNKANSSKIKSNDGNMSGQCVTGDLQHSLNRFNGLHN